MFLQFLFSSQYLLEQLDAWQQIVDWRTCPYRRLGVWELAQAYTEFTSTEIGESHLGHIIENRIIQLSLWQEIAQHEKIEMMCPETLCGLEKKAKIVSDVQLKISID